MVIFKNIFRERSSEFGSTIGFERTESLGFHKNAKPLDLIATYTALNASPTTRVRSS